MRICFKKYIGKIRKKKKKKDNDVNAEMAQPERNKNKCFASAFRYI